MNATTHVVMRKNDRKYFKVVTHPFLMTELNSADPDNSIDETETSIPSGDLSVLLLNGYKLVNGANRISSSNSSRSRGSTSRRSRGTGTTKSMSTMSTMSSRNSRNSRNSKGGKTSRNVKTKNKTKKGKM